jgi:hypothetical protein
MIEFTPKGEPWVKYKLEDGTILFARFILTKVYRSEQHDAAGQPIYGWSSQSLFATSAPANRKGEPTNPVPTSLAPGTFEATPVDFERVGSEQWNVYEFSDGTLLRTKLEISSVARTEMFNPDGDPFYVISSQPIVRLKVPPSLLKKQVLRVSPAKDVYK